MTRRGVVWGAACGCILCGGIGSARAQSAPPRIVTIRDGETEALIRSYASPLFRVAGIDPGLVRIMLLRDRAINAFVATGNRMLIHTGLIQQVDGAGELIGVMAHETGHVSGGHLARLPEQMQQALIASIAAMLAGAAAGAMGGGQAGVGVAMGGQALAERGLYAFTRAQENAADQAALAFLDRNGWSARGLLRLFERLRDQELLAAERQDPYLRTHPLTRERMEAVEAHLARSRYADAPLPAEFDSGLRMVKAKLDGFLDSPQSVMRRFPETDNGAPARYARAIALHRSGRTQPSVELIDGLLKEQPQNPWLHELKGQVLFEGQRPREAIAPYRTAVGLVPDEPTLRMELGRVLIATDDPALLKPAVAELQASLRLDDENAFAWRQLGIAQGRLGNQGEANLALAEEAMLKGDIRAARAQAARAVATLPPGPARLRAQDIQNAVRRENRPR